MVARASAAPPTQGDLEKVVAIGQYKGGVGKTITTINIAAELARLGLNVLVCDLDPQGATSAALEREDFPRTPTLSDVLIPGGQNIEAAVRPAHEIWQPTGRPAWKDGGALDPAQLGHIDLVPSDAALNQRAAAHGSMAPRALYNALYGPDRAGRRFTDSYDVVLLDSQPGGEVATQMACVAAGWLVLVTRPEQASYRSLELTLPFARQLTEGFRHPLRIGGVIVNGLSASKSEHKDTYPLIVDWVKRAAADDPSFFALDDDPAELVWVPAIPESTGVAWTLSRREPLSYSAQYASWPFEPRTARLTSLKRARLGPAYTVLAQRVVNLAAPERLTDIQHQLARTEMPDAMRDTIGVPAAALTSTGGHR